MVVDGDGSSRWVRLAPTTMTVGRDPARDIVLNEPDVSRDHLRITLGAGRVLLEDRGSTNGTFVDGSRLDRAELREGTLVQAGNHVLRLVVPVLLAESVADVTESQRVHRSVPAAARPGPFEDDVSMLVVSFP